MKDVLGRPLEVGDAIVFAEGRRDIGIGKITSMGKKMVGAVKFGSKSAARHFYPNHVLKITDLPELSVYLLSN